MSQTHSKWLAWLAFCLSLSQISHLSAQDDSKREIEEPIASLVRAKIEPKETPDSEKLITELLGSTIEPNKFLSKGFIEDPTERVLAGGKTIPQVPRNLDISKGRIEMPAKQLLVSGALDESNINTAKPQTKLRKSKSQAAQPGKVNWHSNLAMACQQSKVSGKPVLHFQLLGQLDQRFT